LLKRHRDICFRGKESKPISIIITTLAARSYRGENDIVTAMKNIVLRMENCFERAGSKSILRNPINEKELFTDRWTNNDEKDFFDWLRKAQEVFAGNITDSNEKGVLLLESAFGEKIARRVLQTNEHNSNFSAKISPTNVAINSPARPWRK
jgi:G:T-mismatch repair DNA endonuclease (very short patch repair protein)